MNIVLVTSEDDALGHYFWKAYHESGGLSISRVFSFAGSVGSSFSFREKMFVAFKTLGLRGMCEYFLDALTNSVVISSRDRILKTISHSSDVEVLSSRTELATSLTDIECDLLVSVGAPIIFDDEVLRIPRLLSLNVHNGNVPIYRGHFSTFWEVKNREKLFWISIHEMTSRVDSGRVLSKESLSISEVNGFYDLMVKKKVKGGNLLASVTQKIAKNENHFNEVVQTDESSDGKYYGFPFLRDFKNFSLSSCRHNL